MRKFTVFTVILTIIIVVIAAEFFVNDYLPRLNGTASDDASMELTLPATLDVTKGLPDIAGSMQTNVLGADIDYSKISEDDMPAVTDESSAALPDFGDLNSNELLPVPGDISGTSPTYPDFAASTSDIQDFESENYVASPQNVFIRDDQIKSAGFVGAYLENESYDGFLYKTIYTDDIYDVEVTKTTIRTADELLAKVYVFQIGVMTAINEVYEVLKMRASQGLDSEVNETSEFGVGSFYINDDRRPNVAFLTVRIGSLIYGFSYPKEYHSQIKNLITLLDLEF
ncbi:MAG: hypothetical protein ABIH78_00885 [Candidatus Peregrinibacteria bacterium]